MSWEEYTTAARELAKLRRADAKWRRQRDRDAAAEHKLKTTQATANLSESPGDSRPTAPTEEP